jgi:hypothetical protein
MIFDLDPLEFAPAGEFGSLGRHLQSVAAM